MNRKFFLFFGSLFIFIICSFSISFAFAQDLSISLEQSEYFFQVGEEAIIPFNIENTYNKSISGILKYTIKEKVNQANVNYSSTNSQSTTFLIEKETSDASLNFGTANSPTTLILDLKFSYFEKEQREVNLNEIVINFVKDESEKQNEKNETESSSEKSETASQNNSQDPLTQQEQQMQEMQKMLEQMSKEQEPQSQQQKLQNNQLNQDSNALKNEIQKEIKEQQQMKEEFRKNISENKDFQKKQDELLNEGFGYSGENLEPKTNDSGEFEIKYKNKQGEEMSIKGEMENNEMKNLEKHNLTDEKNLLDKLNQDPQFKEFKKQLEEKNFNEQNTNFLNDGNVTTIELNYKNDTNQTAKITADFENNELIEIKLEKDKDEQSEMQQLFGLMVLVAILSFIGYFLYKKYIKKQFNPIKGIKSVLLKKSFDHIFESQKLLKQAEKLFEKKQYKNAYGKAGQAMRLFLSHEYGLGYELTNYEIISVLKTNGKITKDISKCFDLCSFVEFAKYKANKKDFEKIIFIAKKTINTLG